MPPASLPSDDHALPSDCHETLRAACDYWRRIGPPRGLPGRRDLDPAAIPHLLPYVMLVDVLRLPASGTPDGLAFRARLIGTNTVFTLQRDHTGQLFDRSFPEFRNSILRRTMAGAVHTRRPTWYAGHPELRPDRSHVPLERANFPFAANGRTVDLIMTVTVYYP